MAWNDTQTLDKGHAAEQRIFDEMVGASANNEWMRIFFTDMSNRPSEVLVGQGDQGRLAPRVGVAMATISQSETFKANFEHTAYAGYIADTIVNWTNKSEGRRMDFRRNLARAVAQTISHNAWSVLANAFDAGVTMGAGHDAKSLCATDHPIQPASATTWSNKGTTAFSPAAYAAARAAKMIQVSPAGEVYDSPAPRFLVVGPALRTPAMSATGSLYLGVGTAGTDNIQVVGNNPIVSDGVQVIESALLGSVDADNWFLCDAPSGSGLQCFMRLMPTLAYGENTETRIHWENAELAMSQGWNSGRCIYGSEV